jgi:hypothetical protein
MFVAKYFGHADLAMLAAQQCREAAGLLADESEWLGMTEFAIPHILRAESRRAVAAGRPGD